MKAPNTRNSPFADYLRHSSIAWALSNLDYDVCVATGTECGCVPLPHPSHDVVTLGVDIGHRGNIDTMATSKCCK